MHGEEADLSAGTVDRGRSSRRRPTLVDVAEKSGFSLRTVKKVFGGTERVPEATKKRVLEVAKELGYRKNVIASSLALAKTEKIALIYNEVTESYFPEVARGFQRFADDHFGHGFEIEFVTGVGLDLEFQREALQRAAEDDSITGVALQPLSATRLDDSIAQVVAAGKPVVTFGADAPESDRLAYVGPDPYRAGRIGGQILANYVGKKGDVLVLSVAGDHMQTSDRERGFRDRMTEHYPQMSMALSTLESTADVREVVSRALDKLSLVGIFTTYADSPMVGKVLRELNRGDIVLVGFDTSPQTAELMKEGFIKVSLEQDPFDIAYQALSTLFDYLYKQVTPPPVTYTEVTILTSECLS